MLSTSNNTTDWIVDVPIKAYNISRNRGYITCFNKGQGCTFYNLGYC